VSSFLYCVFIYRTYNVLNKVTFIFPVLAISIVLLLSGCVSDLDLTISGAESRIYFYSEIETNTATAFRYSTATGLADKLETVNPEFTSEFNFSYKLEDTELDPPYRFNPLSKLFECPVQAFSPEEGAFYHIKSSLKDFPQMAEISASTYIHKAQELESLEILEINKTGNEFGLDIDMTIRFSVNTNHQYFEIVPYIVDLDDFLDPIKEINLELLNQYPGVICIPHRTSIFIDSRQNKGQFIDGAISTTIPEDVLLNSENILFKLKTINKDHYLYHVNLAKRYETTNAPISEPVISYTNIENGLGLFSGYSSTVDTISLN